MAESGFVMVPGGPGVRARARARLLLRGEVFISSRRSSLFVLPLCGKGIEDQSSEEKVASQLGFS